LRISLFSHLELNGGRCVLVQRCVLLSATSPCFMYRAIATGTTLLLAVTVLATTVAVRQTILSLVDIAAPSHGKVETAKAPALASGASHGPLAPAATTASNANLTFDVVRVDPQGTSVFAGQAPTNSSVSIRANGRELVATTADETGAWAVVTDRKLPAGEYELSLSARSPQHDVTSAPPVRLVIAPPIAPARADPLATGASPQLQAPITFVYNDTTFTAEGRRAADLLAKHLIAQRPPVVSLSGHADERGSDQYNMELSRRRLTVVADYLRASGFAGKLELIPKGRSEPYTSVDRHALPREDLFQLDRRVELLHTR
jgi:outer membrane protein OmpA-like peptidoglycan-associated protein